MEECENIIMLIEPLDLWNKCNGKNVSGEENCEKFAHFFKISLPIGLNVGLHWLKHIHCIEE